MPSGNAIPLSSEQFNRIMINMTEFFDPYFLEKYYETTSIYRNIQPSGPFKLGEGYVRKVHTFYRGLEDQSGLLKWSPETSYRAAGTNSPTDPGNDPCTYKAYMLNYGFKTEQYSGFHTERRSPNYCIKDFIYQWEFAQQLQLILGSFVNAGIQIADNYGREMYMNFANKYVATPSIVPVTFAYDPFSSLDLTVPAGTVISTLNVKMLDTIWQRLNMQVGAKGALAMDNGRPIYGLVINPYDFDDMIHRDAQLEREFRYSSYADILIDGVGKFTKFRGFALTFDDQAPRTSLSGHTTDGSLTFTRVNPYREEATTLGTRLQFDPSYLNAEYHVVNFLIKNVYEKQVPPPVPGRFGKASFGTSPDNMGSLEWINIRDVEHNLLGEKGFFFLRCTAFAKPLENSEYAESLLCKRCPNIPTTLCEPCADATAGAKTVTNAVGVDPDGTLSYYQVDVTISDTNGLLCEASQPVTVTFKDASTAAALIADDSGAPSTYRLTFATAGNWVAYGTGISTITCA